LGYENVETVTQVTIPDDIPSFPLVAGKIVWGVSAVTQAGNGSEITTVTEDIDFTIPGAPGNFRIEDR
jgi:hypothetical protein